MNWYYNELFSRLEVYKRKYAKHPRTAALKMALYSMNQAMHGKRENDILKLTFIPELTDNELNFCLIIEGGIGDMLFSYNFLCYLYEVYLNLGVHIDIVCFTMLHVAKKFFDNKYINNVYCVDYDTFMGGAKYEAYDLCIRINRYPNVIIFNQLKLSQYSKDFARYVDELIDFKKNNQTFFCNDPFYDGQEAIYEKLNGKKRIQQADVHGCLNIKEQFLCNLTDKCDYKLLGEVKKTYENREMLLLSNSAGTIFGKRCITKEWDISYWNRLVEKIKDNYPQLLIIQIGNGKDLESIEGVDLNLINRTSLSETMAFLKEAKLLLTIEGGMVHLRRALRGGKSVVLFGPTDERFFGYKENLNIRGSVCPIPCEWNSDNWFERCPNNLKSRRICMYSITPDTVMGKIKEIFE